MEEGISSEASSLAGHQQLGNLILFYDDNHISIEDDTGVAFSEDVLLRYEAYGWHTQRVDSGEDVVALEAAIANAQAVTDKPSIIAVRTIIGWPAPTSPRATTPRWRASPASSPLRTRRRSGRAARTAEPCTSASANTRWAPSSTASPCTVARASTVARSSCSVTTCARRSACRRSW